jgi:hypothetical protein
VGITLPHLKNVLRTALTSAAYSFTNVYMCVGEGGGGRVIRRGGELNVLILFLLQGSLLQTQLKDGFV